MSNNDASEWKLFDTDLVTVLGILPASESHLYLLLNEPGSGELKIPLNSTLAGGMTEGMFAQCSYRGEVRGGFFVENKSEGQADSSENSGKWLSISGRGALSLLDDAIVWSGGSNDSTRDFAGLSKAEILITLITEAQARGALTNVSCDFTATLDSRGEAWTDNDTPPLTVGKFLLDVVRDFAKAGIDFDITPNAGNFVLSAYKSAKGTDKSGTVYFRVGLSCTELTADERVDKIKNALLVAYKNGYITVKDDDSIAARRRRERLLDIKAAQTSSSATTIGAAEVALNKDPKKSITVKVDDSTGPRIFVDYGLGDYIKLDNKGVENRYRIYGFQPNWVNGKYSSVVLELNSIFNDNDIEMAQDIDWLMEQVNTANDAGLLEVSYWAAIGDVNIDTSQTFGRGMVTIGRDLYTAFDSDTYQKLLKYNLDTKTWTMLLDNTPIAFLMAAGTNLYYVTFAALYQYDTLTDTQIEIGNVFDTSTPGASRISAIAYDGSDYIYIAGNFDKVFSVYNNLISQEGFSRFQISATTWTTWGSGSGGTTSADVKKLLINGTDIYAVGSFASINGVSASNIAKFNGSAWSALDVGLDSGVYAIAIYGANILAGGAFTGGISEWDGAAWTVLGSGVAGNVNDIAIYLTDVYAVGTFVDAGNRIAKYSGGAWYALLGGLNNAVYDVVLDGTNVIVKGFFTEADSKTALYIAEYFTDFQELLDYLSNNSTFDLGNAIHNATAATLTDSSEIPFWHSVTGLLRKITWANVKILLDAIYVKIVQGVNDALMITDGSGNITTFPSSGDGSQYLGGDLSWHDMPTTIHYFLSTTNSDLGGYESLLPLVFDVETGIAASITAADTLIVQFASDADTVSSIDSQTSPVHVHLAKTAGTKNVTVYAKLFVRHSDTSETFLGTSSSTGNLTGSEAPYNLEIPLAARTFSAGDRFILRFYGTPNGGGSTPDATLYYDGTTISHLELSTSGSAGGGGTPAGSDTQVQFNDAGAFGAVARWAFDKIRNSIYLGISVINWTGYFNSIHQVGDSGSAITTAHTLESYGASTTAAGPAILGVRGGGTAAAPTGILANERILTLGGWAFHGVGLTDSINGVKILLVADEDWSVSGHGSRIEVWVTPVGSTTSFLAFTIRSDGSLNIGAAKQYLVNGAQHTHVEGDLSTTDITTNDVTTTKHGLAQKAVAPAATFLNALAILNGETTPTWRVLMDATLPANVGTAAAGTAAVFARRDHVHAATESSITTTDVTIGNVTTTKHGFAQKAVAPAATFLNALAILNGETTPTWRVLMDATLPANVGTAAAGTAAVFARRDHVHAATESSITTTDVTTGDASTTKHGFLIKAVAPALNLPIKVVGIANGETVYSLKNAREMLTAARTYYVRTDGSDSNSGLVNSAGGAFLTIQKAIDVIVSTLDTAGYTVTIQVGTGTFTGGVSVSASWSGGGQVILQGDTTTPANVYLNVTGTCLSISAPLPARFTFQGFKLAGTVGCIAITAPCVFDYGAMEFAASGTHISANVPGIMLTCISNYSITGGAGNHWVLQRGVACLVNTRTITLTGAPAFTTFAAITMLAVLRLATVTFTGAASAGTKQYISEINAAIYTTGGVTIPGGVAGTTATGGQYI